MSSAALQTANHQAPTLSSPPLSSSNRPYPSHASPIIEANNVHTATTSSPSSRRPPSRKTSGNGHPSVLEQNGSPNVRSGMPYHTQQPAPSERVTGMAPSAPPRTSSTQQSGSSRRAYPTNERQTNSNRHSQQEGSRSATRADAHGSTENGQRSKRATHSHYPQDSTKRPAESRDSRGATTVIPVRTHQSAPAKQSREAPENPSLPAKAEDLHDPRVENTAPQSLDDSAAPPPAIGMSPPNEERRSGRSRHDYSRTPRGNAIFGDFILGNTIGEGEFGKVKLGWRQDSNAQVAIKLIKRDTVGSNPNRLAKIKREVTILRELQHPNIVQLIDMVETDRYIGIILEYASGGELFDHILNNRYLKDQSARRLFAQLISGVGYLHKKGIVHRDLKLENLLLDRNRNIIITDFGFANTFDPNEELREEEEYHLSDRDYVKKTGLDKVKPNGMRKGDLMQTSCGSPCYAAPELVVSDCLYTGRKVDVWSCGVILYAMLAGYLPFDDDPANPEGDNINLLYKYIVSTPLTFPEYVTPHARDLLRRILVPNPRKRADLFEVARHSWLSDYAHVVEFITSSTTLPSDVQNSTPNLQDEQNEASMVARSNSVREKQKPKTHSPTAVGGLNKTHGTIDTEVEAPQRTPKETKRRTVQVEYVAPTTQTQRGAEPIATRTQNRSASRGRNEQQRGPQDKPLPRDPPQSSDAAAAAAAAAAARPSSSRRPPSAHRNAGPNGPSGPRDYRAAPENTLIPPTATGTRPQTGGSMSSAASMGLQSKGYYGLPAPPAVADTNAEGRIQQPQNVDEQHHDGRPSTSVPAKFAQMSGMNENQQTTTGHHVKGHKRSSTIGEIGSRLLGRSGSVFGRHRKRPEQPQPDKSRKYPPVSMTSAMATGDEPGPRPSMESKFSRRSFSLGLGKKRSGSVSGSQESGEKTARRFSLIPPSFSAKSGVGKDGAGGTPPPLDNDSRPSLPIQDGRLDSPRGITSHGDARGSSPIFDPVYNNRPPQASSNPHRHQRYASAQLDNRRPNAIPPHLQTGSHFNAASDSSLDMRQSPTEPQMTGYQQPYSESDGQLGQRTGNPRGNRVVLQKNAKRFTDAYDQEEYRGHEGSSGAAKRVMDFFRRRGKARGGDER